MKVINGDFGKQTEEEMIPMGQHMIEQIAHFGLDKMESGSYALLVETENGMQMLTGSQPMMYTSMLLDRAKLAITMNSTIPEGELQ